MAQFDFTGSADPALTQRLAFDIQGLNALQGAAKMNSPQALRSVAQQFEALLLQMMLKSMRDTIPENEYFDSTAKRTYTDMLDQQLSLNMAKRGIGIADMLTQQLSKYLPNNPAHSSTQTTPPNSIKTEPPASATHNAQASQTHTEKNVSEKIQNLISKKIPEHVQQFWQQFGAEAQKISEASGIPSKWMLAQAALETGWGKKLLHAQDGRNSYNLFGIKADKSWQGKVVEAMTTEYIEGSAYQKMQKFRAYNSYAESFADYAKMIGTNPRYKHLLGVEDPQQFAQALQKAGYATDPNYAQKLGRILARG